MSLYCESSGTFMVRLLDAVPAKHGSRVRAPYILGAILLSVFGVLYWSYVRHRWDYLTNRDLRLLSAAAAQIDARIDVPTTALKTFARNTFWDHQVAEHDRTTIIDRLKWLTD